VDLAAGETNGAVYAVGNAPTALLRLVELVRQGDLQPALILGFPVGFVQAAESKQALAQLDCPYITNVGRKGGSNIVAAAVNALILLAGADNRKPA
jgi:precorrin-8X/cobalt-precorrin-8 methylmutase